MNDAELRSRLIRLAHDKPSLRKHVLPIIRQAKGFHMLRKHVLPIIRQAKGETFFHMLSDLQARFMGEVMGEASKLLKSEGFDSVKTSGNTVTATRGSERFSLNLTWDRGIYLNGVVSLGRQKKPIRGYLVTSVSAHEVASQTIYAHFHGLVA